MWNIILFLLNIVINESKNDYVNYQYLFVKFYCLLRILFTKTYNKLLFFWIHCFCKRYAVRVMWNVEDNVEHTEC
jgi:hypothetical protein